MKLPSLLLLGLFSLGATAVAQAQTPSVHYLGRIGLFSDPEHMNTGVIPGLYLVQSSYKHFTDSGYATGSSFRFNTTGQITGEDLWVTNTVTGATKAIGVLEVLPLRLGVIQGITEDGVVWGYSSISPSYNTLAGWVADAESGATVRTGLFGPEFTSPTGVQSTTINRVTEDGLAYGSSVRYSGNFQIGEGVWIMNTDNGVISRAGFFGAGYSRADNYQYSQAYGPSDLGFVLGYSNRYIGNDAKGKTAWVASVVTGASYPVGLYQPPLYLSTDGFGDVFSTFITHSGYVIGDSARFNGNTNIGRAAWIHNLTGNTAKRVGLTTAEFTDSTTGTQFSQATFVSETGSVVGTSKRYSGATDLGTAAWVANFATGISVRAGLTGPEFTRSNGYQNSSNITVSTQGNAGGESTIYVSDADKGSAAWVFNKNTGTSTRVGFYSSPEYISPNGTVYSGAGFYPNANSTWAQGGSARYNQSGENIGGTLWKANPETGVTVPVGLYGSDYLSSEGKQETQSQGSVGEHFYGFSQRYNGIAPAGKAAWVADYSDASATERIGYFGTAEFILADGSQNSIIEGQNDAGHIWGYSSRAESAGGGQVAWVYNLVTGTQQQIKVQSAPNGKTNTSIKGVTKSGLVWGTYIAYNPVNSSLIGTFNFVWSPTKGYKTLEVEIGSAMTADGWSKINDFKLNRYGMIVVNGARSGNTGIGVFRAYFAP